MPLLVMFSAMTRVKRRVGRIRRRGFRMMLVEKEVGSCEDRSCESYLIQ